MKTHTIRHQPWEIDALEARFALRATALLSQAAETRTHEVAERLRVAREQALERARALRRAPAAEQQAVQMGAGPVAALGRTGSEGSRWHKLAALVPLAALVAGLLAIQQWHLRSQIDAAAEVDVQLLADDLPPAAYSDPGFAEFLKTPARD